MSKEIYISSTPHETRLAIVEKDELTEIYYERENEYTLAGSIYNGRVTRVLPGMQSSFVDIGLERDAFLYITDFMEEAGDAADFDSAGPVAGGAGAARSGNGERSSRGEGRAEGRDGGRGRREDRGREGQNGAAKESAIAAPRDFAPVARDFGPVDDEGFGAAPAAVDSEEIGEGAPGADGSRRWRGRRGRRRGRTNGEQGAEGSATSERSESAPAERSPEPEARTERAAYESRAGEHRGGQDRAGEHRAGRDRGDGDRSRGGERGPESGAEQGSREGRHNAVRERFAPRGGASRESGRETHHESGRGEGVEIAAAAEPFILPGESLSKYRRGDRSNQGADAPTSQSAGAFAAPIVQPRPSTEVQPLVGWDGGLVLPGETLSRHREQRAEGRSGTSSGARGAGHEEAGPREAGAGNSDQGRGRDRRRDRDERRGGGGREGAARTEFSAQPQRLDPAEAVLPAATSQHEPEANGLPFRDDAPGFEVRETETRLQIEQQLAGGAAFEPQTDAVCEPTTDAIYESRLDSAQVETAESVLAEAASEAAEEFHETVAEYEPEEEASASVRVDPAGASEFRQSAPGQAFVVDAEEEAREAADAAHDRELEHAFTAVQASGEMISENAREEEAPHAATAPSKSETAPIEHETAVQSVHAAEAEVSSVPFATAPNGALSASFEPGDGQLEEELLDEEEGEIGGLHASAFDDDTEEETLDNAADLGSMIRDMSIDEITRAEPAELDEDDEEDFEDDDDEALEEEDLEEEDLEHDDLEQDEHGEDELDSEVSGHDISEAEEDEFAEGGTFDESRDEAGRENGNAALGEGAGAGREGQREAERHGRRDGRRGGRDRSERGGERGGDRGHRDRRGATNARSGGGGRGHGDRGGGRTMQATDLPAISDLLKPGQEVLVQIAKEPIAKKGARITSHIALPGRFLVFMPTVGHIGVSRKIESDGERRRLKEILLSERGEASGGFIVRTAASGASEEELRSDLRFLLNLWADIKQRSESSKSPALIYHDLNLVERILRDQVTDNFSAIWVDTETEYERVLRFLQRFQPSLIRRVKLYTKDTPLFEQFGITAEIDKALRSKVWLKSGGSIVINQTEALVAIDINTGKYVGKTARLEDTIVKTNLDAIPEIVRQIRLRDLGGIIIIDFIDMDERKNRNKVMAALEDELKKDRAPSKVLQFNDFGLVAITRKRVKQSLERTLSSTCGVCQGTGMTKSPVTVCNDIYIEMRKMHKLMEKGDIMLRVNPEVVKQLKSGSGKWLQEMEEMSGKTILVKSDPSLHPEQFDIH